MANILQVQTQGGEARERERFDRDSTRSFARHRGMIGLAMLAILAASVPGIALLRWAFLETIELVISGAISLAVNTTGSSVAFDAAGTTLDATLPAGPHLRRRVRVPVQHVLAEGLERPAIAGAFAQRFIHLHEIETALLTEIRDGLRQGR